MDLLHRLTRYLETKRVEGKIHRRLAHLDDRNLADIGLARGDIGRFARAAARPGVPPGRTLPMPGRPASSSAEPWACGRPESVRAPRATATRQGAPSGDRPRRSPRGRWSGPSTTLRTK
jgi:uncharacterized protein YjiS (DUF1127 family)